MGEGVVSGRGKFGAVGDFKVCCVTMGVAGGVGVGPKGEDGLGCAEHLRWLRGKIKIGCAFWVFMIKDSI